jgi:hypothetical protein
MILRSSSRRAGGARIPPRLTPLDPTMDAFKTVFRLVVMCAALGIGYQAWQLYGPPKDQLKSLAVRALDAARTALEGTGQKGSAAALTADPRPVAPAFGASAPVAGQVMQAQALVPAGELSAGEPITPPALAPPPALDALNLTEAAAETTAVAAAVDSELQALYSQLDQLGAHDCQLSAWGSGGQLYRFSCRAPLAGTATFQQHFDAVANGPTAAVEAVLAKVAAWRAQRNSGSGGRTLR